MQSVRNRNTVPVDNRNQTYTCATCEAMELLFGADETELDHKMIALWEWAEAFILNTLDGAES